MQSVARGHLSDKDSRDISRDIWQFSSYFKIFMYLLQDFLWYPLWCSAELCMAKATLDSIGINLNMEQAVNTININCCILKHLGVKNIEIYNQ
jgi:hypothetical protein